MFDGCAEEAMNYYSDIIEDAKITSISRYKANEAGKEGTVMVATFKVKGQEFMCIDSAIKHDFSFTPAISLYVNCDSKDEIKSLFRNLSEGGNVFMDLTSYGFSDLYGWVEDKFGVSWQLNLD